MLENGQISQQQYNEAQAAQFNRRMPRLTPYAAVYGRAQAEIEAEISNPVDMVNAMFGFSLPCRPAGLKQLAG